MPAKGSSYASVEIDLAKWCSNYMDKYKLNQSDMARRLKVNRGRVTQMLHSEMNTTFYVEKAVNLCEGGNWLAMSKYARSEKALRYLEAEDARVSLRDDELQDWDALFNEITRYAKSHQLKRLRDHVKRLNGIDHTE